MAALVACLVAVSSPLSASTVIVEFDFRTLDVEGVEDDGDTVNLNPGTTFSYGNLNLVFNAFNSPNTVVFTSYTKGIGFGVVTGINDPVPLDGLGNNGEAINILFRSSIPDGWEFAMYSLNYTDANSDDFAFAAGGWTVYQGTDDWVNNRDPLNQGPQSNRIANYDANLGGGSGNGQINELRNNQGTALINPSRSFEERVPGFFGINIHSRRNPTALYLSGLAIELSEEDALALGLATTEVPVPAPLGMLAVGCAMLAGLRRRTRSETRNGRCLRLLRNPT
ncbi:MAG: hypothetical protein AAGC81_11365 [Pseudomonadota bacterium]